MKPGVMKEILECLTNDVENGEMSEQEFIQHIASSGEIDEFDASEIHNAYVQERRITRQAWIEEPGHNSLRDMILDLLNPSEED